MSDRKSEFILNPEYYSIDTYIEEENTEPIYLRVLIQLSTIFIIFGILFFAYKYIMKNYYDDICLWIAEDKVSAVVQKAQAPRIIREKVVVSKIEVGIKVEKKKIVKVPLSNKVKTPPVEYQELSDEYIKLVEQSLVNY